MSKTILRIIYAGLIAGLMTGCAQLRDDMKKDPKQLAETAMAGPESLPGANRTRLDAALRCMDGLFKTYGVRGVPVLLEELPDKTGKVHSAGREMFMSATSRQTQRSQAIRLISYQSSVAFGDRRDAINAAEFVVQGSVAQLDESVVRRVQDGAVCIGPVCFGTARSGGYNALGLDLSVVRTSNLSMVPGTASSNVVLISKSGIGADGEVNLKKFGSNFNFTLSLSEGQGQALRSLVELGSIELYGRMMRMPYWSCLGADMTNLEVKAEVDDWWESLAADMPALMKWLQRQMKARGLYEGDVDGVATSQLLRAVQAYQMAMGLNQDADLDIRFFRSYLAADHQRLEQPAKQLLAKMPKPLPVVTKVESPKVAALRVQDKRGVRTAYKKGEPLEVEVTVLKAGHLYCYMVGQNGVPDQFFPNSVQRSTFVTENARLLFPGKLPFRLVANRQGGSDTVACVISQRSLGTLPLSSGTSMSARSAKDLESIFMRLTGETVSVGSFEVQSR